MNEVVMNLGKLDEIKVEIIKLKSQTADNMILMGKYLLDAKKLLPHGEWGRWVSEEAGFSQRTASQFIKIAKEYGSNSQSISNLDATKIYILLELPIEDREEFTKLYDLKTMSTREMKTKIKEFKKSSNEINIWSVVDKVWDGNVYEIDISELKDFPNHEYYFWDMKGKEYIKLLSSIESRGVLEPILITRDKMIISGHQRVRACKDLGSVTIPAYYFHSENKQSMKLDDLLLSTFFSCNMNTHSAVFYLAVAWKEFYFGNEENVSYYLEKFINQDIEEATEEWIDKFLV